jgi:hypothetical protein
MDQLVHVFPRLGPRLANSLVGAVGETDRVQASAPKPLYVVWAIVHVNVCANLLLLLHEAEVPVRDGMLVQPVNGLLHGDLVKVVNE